MLHATSLRLYSMKIHEIQLQTPSLALVQDFYHGLLDLDIQPGLGSGRDVVRNVSTINIGLSQLHFSENTAAKGIYHFAFNIPANQIAEAQQFLHQRSIRILPTPDGEEIVQFPDWHAQSVYFFDPAGNVVEFIARRDLHNENDRPFGPDSLLAISEIGIVRPDVFQWRAQTLQHYGIGDFDKQPASPGFSALGSDQGLFIVVPTSRHWLMTEIPATQNPLFVRFENEEGQIFTEQL